MHSQFKSFDDVSPIQLCPFDLKTKQVRFNLNFMSGLGRGGSEGILEILYSSKGF